MPPSSSIATITSPDETSSGAQLNQQEHIREALLEMAAQDWLVLAYHALVVVGVLLGARTELWPWALSVSLCLWIGLSATLLLVRARQTVPGSLWRAVTYRLALIGSMQVSYVLMRWLLPVINPGSLDTQLHQLDLRLFGFEPAVAIAPYMTPAVTEWFSFAYYGYFLLLLLHLLPVVVFATHRAAVNEFTLGLTLVFCTGQGLYMLVPGYGPGVGLPELFSEPLPVGFFSHLVNDTVERWGAQKDIFPSIHTAVPTFLCLWGFGYRKATLFSESGLLRRWYQRPIFLKLASATWLMTLVFSLNIIAATMFLRWHYLIDVIAGLVVGVGGYALARKFSPRELASRDKRGLGRIWPYFSNT